MSLIPNKNVTAGSKNDSLKKSPTPELELVMVSWLDAVAEAGWETTPTLSEVHLIHSVGWIIKENDVEVVLSADASVHNMEDGKVDTNRRLSIPKTWVQSRKRLVVDERQAGTIRNTKKRSPR